MNFKNKVNKKRNFTAYLRLQTFQATHYVTVYIYYVSTIPSTYMNVQNRLHLR